MKKNEIKMAATNSELDLHDKMNECYKDLLKDKELLNKVLDSCFLAQKAWSDN